MECVCRDLIAGLYHSIFPFLCLLCNSAWTVVHLEYCKSKMDDFKRIARTKYIGNVFFYYLFVTSKCLHINFNKIVVLCSIMWI